MKIVISCAGSKVTCVKPNGYMQTKEGKPVMFVAQPLFAPKCDNVIYKAPDDLSDAGQVSWRTRLQEYNQAYSKNSEDNQWKLCPAYRLYKPNKSENYSDIYRALKEKFGVNMYILSAGWGLIRADFLTPQYKITFNRQADRCERRKFVRTDSYFNQLLDDSDGPIVFLGGRDYIPLFCWLTEKCYSCRIVYYYQNSKRPEANGCKTEGFKGEKDRTWYYECAKDFIAGKSTITCR